MIESHIQILHAGPIQPIGLPPVAAMGVTNARVLHRRMLNKSNHSNNNSLNLLGAKRCLFGSPAPGEIQSLYKEEMRRNRERFIQRYNYDILNEKFVDDVNESSDPEHFQDSSDKCNIIHSERAEDRLHDDPSDADSDSNSVISTFSESDCDKKCNFDSVQYETSNKDDSSTLSPMRTSPSSSPSTKDKRVCERLKPYSRQFLITEFYNPRKTIISDVSQLPKPQQAKLRDEQKTIRQCENV